MLISLPYRAGWTCAATRTTTFFLECADTAGADYLITGNSRHFPKFWKKTKIITAREFVSLTAPHLIS
jgi:predicted nucleic acid-binding protein